VFELGDVRPLEDDGLLVFGDARAVVFDRDDDVLAGPSRARVNRRFRPSGQPDGRGIRVVRDGVLYEVLEGVPDFQSRRHRKRGLDVRLDARVGPGRPRVGDDVRGRTADLDDCIGGRVPEDVLCHPRFLADAREVLGAVDNSARSRPNLL